MQQINDLKKDLRDLSTRLEKLEVRSLCAADDQIFLGALLTFITVFVTLQFSDVSNFFLSVNSPSAHYSALILQITGISSLVIAIAFRYWATLTDDSRVNVTGWGRFYFWYNSSSLRYISLESLLTGFFLVIVIISINCILIVPNGLVETCLTLLVVVIILIFGWLENKILQLYKNKKLIPDNALPFARQVFSGTAFFVSGVALLLALIKFYSFNYCVNK